MGFQFARVGRVGIVSAASLITVLTLVSRVFGLLRKLAQSWAMSDGAVATAYDTANTVPNVLFEIAAGGALSGAIIPLVSFFLVKNQRAEAAQTVSAILTWIIVISVPLAIVVTIASGEITGALLGSATDPDVITLSSSLLRMFAWQVPLYGISVVCAGVLQAYDRFILPAVAPLLSSLVVIAVFLVYASNCAPHVDPSELTSSAIYLLGWGTTAGVMVFSLPQLFPIFRLMPIRLTLAFPPGIARRTLRLAGAGLAALIAQQVAIVVIMYATNQIGGVGTYNVFNYSYAVFMVPYAVLAVPIATVTFPTISKAVSANDVELAANVTARSTRLVLVMGVVAAGLLIVEAIPAQTVLEVGRNIEYLDYAMTTMALGLVGYSLLYHGARVLYALDAGKYVIIVNTCAWGGVVAILIAAINLSSEGRFQALTWVGVAMSIGMSVGGIGVLWAIRSRLGSQSLRGVMRTACVATGASLVSAVCARIVVELMMTELLWPSMLLAIVSACVGAVICIGGAATVMVVFDRTLIDGIRGTPQC